VESIDILREELAKLMPEAAVLQLSEKAKARERQRLTGEAYFALLMQAVLAACALWVGVLAWLNVRERQYEIGVLRALGYGSLTIAFLVLGKAALLGAIAAGLGFEAGSWLAALYGPDVFEVTAKSIAPEYALLKQALWAAPLFAAACSLIPASAAVAQDPAIILRNE
jgi:ABC-type antimicrobial peptide transport system permease subunit